MMTSTIEQQKQLIDIVTAQLKQAKTQLKKLKTIETKISQTVKTLQPILDQYPEYLKVIADQFGLLLPKPETTPKPRIIPIEFDETPVPQKGIELINNNNTSTQPKTHNILVEKLQELAQIGLQYNLTININTEKLTAEVLAPHPKTEKPYLVVTLNIRSPELSKGWMWLYDINIKGDNYHNICYTGSPTDFAEVISKAAKYYFEKPIIQLINKLTSDFPQDWQQDKNTNLWKKILTETNSEQLTQNTNNFTGIVELKTGNYQWNFQPKTKTLTLYENNNDTTNNTKNDSKDIEKSGDVLTPPTSDISDIKDTANIPTITWYSSSNGEVQVGSQKRYFRLVLDISTNTHEIKFKKSIDSGNWIQSSKSTEIFASAIEQEFKTGKPDAAEAILQKIYDVAEALGGKLIRCSGSCTVGQFGTLYVPNESIEVGYNDGSWWYFRPGYNKVYCTGDVLAFAETLTLDSKKWVKPNNSVTELFADLIKQEFKAGTNHENNNDTTSDNNTKNDSKDIEKSGDVLTPPTSDISNINPTITWYNSNSGEVTAGSEKRYFRVFLQSAKDEHEIKFKKSTDSKKWVKPNNSVTELFADLIKQEFKAGTNHEAETILQKLYEAAEEIAGKFVGTGDGNVGTLGYFYILDEEIEVGYNDSSWWFIRPGRNKVYCNSNVTAFAKILKGLKTDVILESKKTKDIEIATAETDTNKNPSKSSDCWYTPPQIIKLVEVVLGTIDLDPCADDGKHISAKYHYTITENGLNQEWQDKVFLNPPYSCPGKWVEKLISEIDSGRVTEAIALLPASTDTKWFAPLWNQPICFWKGRIKFLDTNYQPKLPARQSHCLVYWGENVEKFSQVFHKYGEVTNQKTTESTQVEIEIKPTKTVENTLTLTEQIKPILSETWVLKTINDNEVILYETLEKNSDFVQITKTSDSLTPFVVTHQGESYFSDNIADIKFALVSNNFTDINWEIISEKEGFNSAKSTDSFDQKEEVEKTLTLTEQITPILRENWAVVTINNNEVTIYETLDKNSDWVKIKELHNNSLATFIISHGTEFSNNVQDINSAIESVSWWFNQNNSTDKLKKFIEIINSYSTDLTIVRKDSSTAYIQRGQDTLGSIFDKDDETLELPEREKQILTELYSIDIDNLITDINQKIEKVKNNYLIGIASLDAEFDYIDTLQNALYSLSDQLNLVIIRQGKSFKVYNSKEWLENYLGSIKVNDSEIVADEELIDELLNQYSVLLNQLTIDIVKGETGIEIENYIITNETLKELLTKANWDNWNQQDFDTAHNLLNELVESSPAWNQLIETIRQQRQTNDDDNQPNDGGINTPPSTPHNPNNNGGEQAELNTENLDTLETAIKTYGTDLKLEKNHSKITFYQDQNQLGYVTKNTDKILAEPRLISHLEILYGIDIKGLIESIEYTSIDNCFELDPFEHIGSNNNAFKPLGCLVAPTWKEGHERRGILQSVAGEIATIQWLDGEQNIEQININLLRFISYPPLSKLDSSQISAVNSYSRRNTDNKTECDSDEPTAESIASLNFGGLIAAPTTTTINITPLSTEVNHAPLNNQETSKNLVKNGKAISFGKTITELLSGQKTVTRRLWKDNYAKRFLDDWNTKPREFLYPALTKGYHVGGERVGYIKITHKPYQEKLADMPDSELAAEGFPDLSKQQFIDRFFDGDDQQIVWVIRFEFIPNKENQKLLSEHKKTQTSLEEQLINKMQEQLSILDEFIFERTLGIPKISLHISIKEQNLGKIFTDPHESLVSDISLEESLMEQYGLDIKSLILDVVNGKQLQIENYRQKLENTASNFFDEEDDPTWLNLIKAEIEKLEDFKASHDEVDLTVTHYGTYIGSIHHNQDDELEVEQKLIGELAKYDLNLEAFLVAENIPYKLYHLKPVVVTDTQTLEPEKKSPTDSNNGSKHDSNQLNDNELDAIQSQGQTTKDLDLLDQLAAVFEGFDNILTKRSGDVLWFFRGDENLNPCSMTTLDGNTFTLLPTIKLEDKIENLFGIDLSQVCFDLETGKTVNIHDYVNQSIWQKTIIDSSENNETISSQNTAESQTSDELKASTTIEESETESYEHPDRLHWVKDTSMYNRSETYIVWNGSQKCGKIHLNCKGKKKANIGKWYVSPQVCGPYYDTISEAATACYQQLTKSSRAVELELSNN